MLIKNIVVYNDAGIRELKNVRVTEDGARIIFNLDDDLSLFQEEKVIDSKGYYFLMPGMLDSHVHGQGGKDFADLDDKIDDEGLKRIVEALGRTGLSYALATLVSMPVEALKKSLIKINDFIEEQERNPTPGHTQIVGVHLEGPFISKKCKGAHAEEALQDSISMEQFRAIIKVAPNIRHWKITIAPDLPGAENFIKQTKALEQEGIFVKVFIGHCNPDDEEAINRAIAAGACGFTHLGNACQESCSRETRVLTSNDAKSHLVQWILKNPDSCPPGVELIVDGVHLSSSFISLIQHAVRNKIILVTDALGPTGCKDGVYKLGVLNIRKEQNNFYLADDDGNFLMKEGILPSGEKGFVKTLAGSAASLAFCAQNYFEILHHETIENRMDLMYSALVTNPRITSLSKEAIQKLPDNKNFSIFNNKGQLILSSCNGIVIDHQQAIYVFLLETLQKRASNKSLLQNKIDAAGLAIQLEVDNKLQNNETVDYHFYNGVLSNLYQVAINPQDKKLAQYLEHLAEYCSDTPSIGKKVLGAISVILGLLLVATSIILLGLTLGGSSIFLSGLGVAMGLTVMQSQIAAVVGCSIGAASGAGLAFFGFTMFQDGQRKGLSKELEAVKEEVFNPTIAS